MKIARETVYAAVWAKAITATLAIVADPYTVPATGPYTVSVASPAPARAWSSDDGVSYALGGSLTAVTGAPAAGQYSVTAGVYTFNAVDAAKGVLISYHYAAFFTMSRRLRHWDDVSPNEQPALYMVQHEQQVVNVKGLGPTWTFRMSLFVYDNCGSESSALPGQRMNYLVDAVDNAFKADFIGYQTLGNLVSHCWVAGPIEVYEGYVGMMDQSVAIIPIEVKVPDSSGPV